MPAQSHRWVVDAIEESAASIEVDGGEMVTVPIWLLPAAARQGDVLRITHDRPPHGERSTLTIEVDAAATKKALAESAAQVSKARTKKDPGGDITL
jgi:hypothetical protein